VNSVATDVIRMCVIINTKSLSRMLGEGVHTVAPVHDIKAYGGVEV